MPLSIKTINQYQALLHITPHFLSLDAIEIGTSLIHLSAVLLVLKLNEGSILGPRSNEIICF